MSEAGFHPLLARQLAKTGGLDAAGAPVAPARLLALVSAAYAEAERDRARSDHANRVVTAELEETMAALELQNLRFRAAGDAMTQGMCLFDAHGRATMPNRRFLEFHGFADEAAVDGLTLQGVLDSAPVLIEASPIERRLLAAELFSCGNGQTVELAWPGDRTLTVHRNATTDGGFLLTVSDVTEAKQASARIAYLARHDPLTDLPNRVQLRERLGEIVRNGRRGESCAVICLDLDRFKPVNDTHGHPVGDALLVAVALRLKTLVRSEDVIARLGGDEFAIVLQDVRSAEEVERFAGRVIAAIGRRFAIAGHKLSIGASLGIAIEPVATLDPAEALRRADIALYAAKDEGRAGWRLFTEAMQQQACARMALENDLRAGLEKGEFFVEYQPQLDLETRRLTSVEALLRWQSPTRGLVMPTEFIPVCEETGLIDAVGRFVLETATRDALDWPADTVVAVNLSPVQFQSGKLVAKVKRALALSGLPAERLELEVTENLMLEDTARVLDQIQSLKRMGCRISLDDFGVGYSSLSYIRQFPFDKIKIDRSFVRDLEHSSDSLAIIRAVSGLCESLALKSAAEGVETMAQLEILRKKRIDSAQGFLIGRPMGAGQVGALIAASHGEAPAEARRDVA